MSSRPGTVVSPMNFIIQQSRSFEDVCVLLRLTSCLFPVLDSQATATELSSRRRSDLVPSSAARHIRAVTSRLLHSLEDILLLTVLFIILLSRLRSDIVILDTLIVLLTYLLKLEVQIC